MFCVSLLSGTWPLVCVQKGWQPVPDLAQNKSPVLLHAFPSLFCTQVAEDPTEDPEALGEGLGP